MSRLSVFQHPLTTGSMLAPATNANTQYVNPSKPYQRQPSCLDVVEDKERFPKLLKRYCTKQLSFPKWHLFVRVTLTQYVCW